MREVGVTSVPKVTLGRREFQKRTFVRMRGGEDGVGTQSKPRIRGYVDEG